jgi:uncharacterized protein YbaP (TraB family)
MIKKELGMKKWPVRFRMGCLMAAKKMLLPGLILFCSFATAWAGASVWVVRSGPNVTYIGGTCHLLRQSDHPLPKAYAAAYQASGRLLFETELEQLQSTAFQQKLAQEAMYTDGTTLDRVLSPAIYRDLSDYCNRAGLPIAQLRSFKPFMVILTLVGVELQKMGVSSEAGVDHYFFNKAKMDGKPTGGLETVQTQLDFLTSMSDGIEDRFVAHGLKDLNRFQQLIDQLIAVWREGDEAKLYRFFLRDMKKDFPKLYQRLVDDRNTAWLPQIKQLIASPQTEFVLVGVAHLVGPRGVIALLKKQGLTVEKLD